MKVFRINLTISVFLCFLTTAGSGQNISLSQYSIKDGLPSNNIESIYQDSRGFMWFGTTNGFSVFDRRTLHNYGIKDGLPHAFVQKIFEDINNPGMKWLPAGRHVCRFSKGKIFTYTLQPSVVIDIYQDKNGVVWCATHRGILQINNENIRIFRPTILDTTVYAITETGDSVIWFAIDKGLISYSRITKSFHKIDLQNYPDGWFKSFV